MDIHLNEMAGDILVFLTGKHSVSALLVCITCRRAGMLPLLGYLGLSLFYNLNSVMVKSFKYMQSTLTF